MGAPIAILKIPKELLGAYKRDPDNFICDIANYPREPILRYFKNPNALYAAVKRGRLNPFDFIKHEFNSGYQAHNPKLRYLHFDLSLGGDLCAFACGHASHFVDQEEFDGNESKTVKLPFHFIDFVGIILNPTGDQVWLPVIVNIVKELREKRGFNIGLCTFDRFQSAYIMQTLRDEGFITSMLSIDRTTSFPILDIDKRSVDGYKRLSTEGNYSAAMASLRDSVNHRRISIPFHRAVDEKMTESEFEIEAKGAQEEVIKKKVTHTSETNIDLLQAVAGTVFNIENNERWGGAESQIENSEYQDKFYDTLDELNQESTMMNNIFGNNLGEEGDRHGNYLG